MAGPPAGNTAGDRESRGWTRCCPTPHGRFALSWRRSLAYEISLLRAAEAEGDLPLDALTPDAAERLLTELTSRLIAVERDLVHFPISYHFSAQSPGVTTSRLRR